MKKKRRILFITTEIAPFNPDSPLSELSRHLPRIFRTQGHDIRVVMPKYSFIRDRKFNLREVIRLREIPVPLAGKLIWVSVKSGFIPDTRVQVYFLENEEYLSRDGVIKDPATGEPYPDNDERFIVFARASVEMLRTLSWQPEIIHCTDWTSALVPYYIRAHYRDNPFYKPSKLVLSIVNYEVSSLFPRSSVFKAGINPDDFKPGSEIELDGGFSYLKAGAQFADKIVTGGAASEKILPELERGWFRTFAEANPDHLIHMHLGIDHNIWNPDKDEKISANYSHRDLSGKSETKRALVEKHSLKLNEGAPLLGCIWDGGDFKALQPVVNHLKSIGGGLVISDKFAPEGAAAEFAKSAPGHIGAVKLLTGLTLKQLMAGSDIILLHPAKYLELLHFKSMKYGAVPIVPNFGFFGDDIIEDETEGTGFIYEKGDEVSMLSAVKRALEAASDEKIWQALLKRAMKYDSSWNRAARDYTEVYESVC